ncbi:MAG TPA: DUF3329 domain-containing protein [Alphaproteobacteria bacterium]|nr:DUF3329 domain-containing protein [Alphaproteobacteria bacterium]
MPRNSPHPWLQPLHRRVLVMAVCVGWLVFEVIQQDPLWLFIAVAATGYGTWDLFLSGNYRASGDRS